MGVGCGMYFHESEVFWNRGDRLSVILISCRPTRVWEVVRYDFILGV